MFMSIVHVIFYLNRNFGTIFCLFFFTSVMLASVEVYLLAEIANISVSDSENKLPSVNIYILAVLGYFCIYYLNRVFLYQVPRKVGEVLSEQLLESRVMSLSAKRHS